VNKDYYTSSKWSTSASCAHDEETKRKRRRNNLTVANWVFAQATHVTVSEYDLARCVFFKQ